MQFINKNSLKFRLIALKRKYNSKLTRVHLMLLVNHIRILYYITVYKDGMII